MEEKFTAAFFAANRERLRTLFVGKAPIVLTANGLLQKSADTAFPFKQDTSFWYFTGITEPDIILVIDKHKEYLIVPDREPIREAFDGAIQHEQLTQQSGIEQVFGEADGWRQLSAKVKKVKHIASLSAAPAYIDHYGMFTNPARARLMARITEINPSVEFLDLRPHVIKMRSVKQPAELAAIEQAVDSTVTAFKKISKKLTHYETEKNVEHAFTQEFMKHGLVHAYDPIVATGANACTLHYVDNTTTLGQKDLLLIDIGAEVDGYAADITRTYALGPVGRRKQAVYKAVVDVQDFAFSLYRPGVTVRAVEKQVQQYMGEKLRELGLIKNIEAEEIHRYYPHATSHFLGLDVHDIGDYDALLEPNMVLTVEPGIYIPEEGIGIRIEDDIVITNEGNTILSRKLPRDIV